MKENSVLSIVEVFPNPCYEKCTIELNLEKDANVNMEIYDMTGKKLYTLCAEEYLEQGQHDLLFDRNRDNAIFQSGIYFCKVSIKFMDGEERSLKEKIVLVE